MWNYYRLEYSKECIENKTYVVMESKNSFYGKF
jgi:hypothetical protein